MPFDGAGNYTRTNGVNSGTGTWAADAAAGDNILSSRHDVHDQDIATALSNALCKDGQSTPSANLPMGGYKFTGLGNGSSATDSAAFGQIESTDGWRLASETWAYASATTITVPSDARTKYSVGDRIKLTQTTVKYFVVTAVAETVLTVTGGTSYTLANAAISSNYYSHAASPVGFPSSFSYTPTLSCSGSMTIGSTTITAARFMVTGRICRIYLEFNGTTGGSAATDIIASLPITQSQAMTAMAYVVTDTGQPAEGFCAITGGNAVFRKPDISNFSTPPKAVECRLATHYEI